MFSLNTTKCDGDKICQISRNESLTIHSNNIFSLVRNRMAAKHSIGKKHNLIFDFSFHSFTNELRYQFCCFVATEAHLRHAIHTTHKHTHTRTGNNSLLVRFALILLFHINTDYSKYPKKAATNNKSRRSWVMGATHEYTNKTKIVLKTHTHSYRN